MQDATHQTQAVKIGLSVDLKAVGRAIGTHL
jgi:hypothetical protein